jgi:hypothetical protein
MMSRQSKSYRPNVFRHRQSAQRLLARLARHGACPSTGDDAQMLLSADLATRRADGMIEISAAGRSHLVRLELSRTGVVDPFLGQHLSVTDVDLPTSQGRARVAMDGTESPLAWLARRKSRGGGALIQPVQLQAGERFRADVTCAQMMPRVTSNWTSSVARDGRNGGAATTFSDAVLAARQRVHHAMDSVGPEFSGLLLDVCCFLKGLEDVERERGWPPRSAKIVLQLGLDRLARHYGYSAEARGASQAHVRTWLAPGAAFVLSEEP